MTLNSLAIAIAFISFLLGSIPTSLIVVRLRIGKDIRTLGSCNPGATNVFRSVGRLEGFIVLIIDLLKGFVPVVFLSKFLYGDSLDSILLAQLFTGIPSILGHVFSPWLKFKGGKGVATGSGVALAILPISFLFAFIAWMAILLTNGRMSLASIVSSYVFCAAVLLIHQNAFLGVLACSLAIFITWTHRSNILRLLKGEEPRFIVNK